MERFLQLKSNGERYFMKEIFYFPQEGDKDAKGELVKRDPSKPHQCTKCLRGFSSPFALKQVCSLTTRLRETKKISPYRPDSTGSGFLGYFLVFTSVTVIPKIYGNYDRFGKL